MAGVPQDFTSKLEVKEEVDSAITASRKERARPVGKQMKVEVKKCEGDVDKLIELFWKFYYKIKAAENETARDCPDLRQKFRTLVVRVREGVDEPIYLDTGKMEMLRGPLRYYPDRNIAKNYSAIWRFMRCQEMTSNGEVLENYITPGAFFSIKLINQSDFVFVINFRSQESGASPLCVFIESFDPYFRMYIKPGGDKLYLGPYSALKPEVKRHNHVPSELKWVVV